MNAVVNCIYVLFSENGTEYQEDRQVFKGKILLLAILSNYFIPKGLNDCFSPTVYVQLRINVSDMAPHSIQTNVTSSSDHFIAISFYEIFKYFRFAFRKIVL
jgi:hypothetical protein